MLDRNQSFLRSIFSFFNFDFIYSYRNSTHRVWQKIWWINCRSMHLSKPRYKWLVNLYQKLPITFERRYFRAEDILADYIQLSTKWSKSPKKQSEWMHSKYSARKSKIRSYRLLFRRFCPLWGRITVWPVSKDFQFSTGTRTLKRRLLDVVTMLIRQTFLPWYYFIYVEEKTIVFLT